MVRTPSVDWQRCPFGLVVQYSLVTIQPEALDRCSTNQESGLISRTFIRLVYFYNTYTTEVSPLSFSVHLVASPVMKSKQRSYRKNGYQRMSYGVMDEPPYGVR
jgi:hypothetical protein